MGHDFNVTHCASARSEIGETSSLPVDLQFAVSRVAKKISGGEEDDLLRRHLARLRVSLARLRALHMRFWRTVLQDDVNVDVLPGVVDAIDACERSSEREFERLLAEHANSRSLLRLYSDVRALR